MERLKTFCIKELDEVDRAAFYEYACSDAGRANLKTVFGIASEEGMSTALFETFLRYAMYRNRYRINPLSRNTLPSNDNSIG
ncbi:MAG: hypothetical protein Q4B26_10115 [Eubacteriales bacterium]|nr:hypothetical protein [Eubacteriales bacterium]